VPSERTFPRWYLLPLVGLAQRGAFPTLLRVQNVPCARQGLFKTLVNKLGASLAPRAISIHYLVQPHALFVRRALCALSAQSRTLAQSRLSCALQVASRTNLGKLVVKFVLPVEPQLVALLGALLAALEQLNEALARSFAPIVSRVGSNQGQKVKGVSSAPRDASSYKKNKAAA